MQLSTGFRWVRPATLAGALVFTVMGSPMAQAQTTAAVRTASTSDLGTVLTDPAGMSLYMYTKDEPSLSNCYDQCATAWPPLLTESNPTGPDTIAAGLGSTMRNDGALQVTYNGMPLYYWQKDQTPGDTTGQNVGGVWFVINPAAAPSVTLRGDASLGDILVGPSGMTLYLFTKDDASKSHCYDSCAAAWPPLLTDSDPTG